MGRLLQYRFPVTARQPTRRGPAPAGIREAEAPPAGLGGHAVGNLLLAALVAVEDGDFEEGVREMNRVLAVRGRVVPATGDGDHASTPGSTTARRSTARAGSRGRERVERVWVDARRRPPARRTPWRRSRRPS